MYSNTNEIFDSDTEFIKYVVDQTKGTDSVILGGHYILLYNDIDDCLEPAIWEENKADHLKELSKIVAGDFPLSTFKLALKIRKQIKQLKDDSSIALLINDHFFQSNSLSFKTSNRLKGNWDEYKFMYFKNAKLPEVYNNIVEQYHVEINSAIFPNTLIHSKYYHSLLFSETSLRKRFEKRLKKELSNSKNFYLNNSYNEKSKLFYKGEEGNLTCLSENGSCGCSGEVMQFIMEVYSKNNNSLIMMVPQDCYESVCVGVEAFISYLQNSKLLLKRYTFIVSTGFNDSIVEKIWDNNKIQLRLYKI